MKKKVSIIVPVYKVEKYLRKCLDSILAQTCNDFVTYLVNDGSPDTCLEIMKEYRLKYPDVFIIIDKENGGISSARNIALKYITTKYVVFIDSDDYIHEQYVEKLLKCAEEQDADIVECGYSLVYENTNVIKDIKPRLQGMNYVQRNPNVICNMSVMAWGKIYKSKLFLNDNILFPEGLIYEDTATMPRLIARSIIVVGIADCLYYYLQRQGSIMSVLDNRIYNLYEIADIIGKDKYAKIYETQFAYYQISRIMILISYIINSNGTNKEIKSAYDYLDLNVSNWKKNEYLINVYRNNKLSSKVYWHLIRNKSIFLIKIFFKIRKSINSLY